MAMQVTEIREWLNALNDGDYVGVNDGGLCLEVDGNKEIYLEIGGIPEETETIMLPDDELKDILTDALENAIGHWAEVRQIQRDEKGNPIAFQVRDCCDHRAQWKGITLAKFKDAIETIQNEEVEVSPAIKDQFKGVEWNVDADGEDAAVQIAAFGEIVFC